MTKVLHLNKETIKQMENHYREYISLTVPQGAIFLARVTGCTITAYRSGKVMFQGAKFESEVNLWLQSNKDSFKTISTKTVSTKPKQVHTLPRNFETLSIIGSDEVGTGDYFGPVVVASAFVEQSNIPILQQLGVQDSKDLTDKQISDIAQKIISIIPYSLLVLHNEKYNNLQQSGYNQGKIKAILHNQALLNTSKRIAPKNPDGILIDQFCEPGVYYNYLKNEDNVIRDNVYFSTKAEGVHLAVAAASIIARYAFVQHFDLLSKDVGFTLPKGAGAKVDEIAASLIAQKGEDFLHTISKMHFANTRKARDIFHSKYK